MAGDFAAAVGVVPGSPSTPRVEGLPRGVACASGELALSWAATGDPTAIRSVEAFCVSLSWVISVVSEVLDPTEVVLGGGVMDSFEVFRPLFRFSPTWTSARQSVLVRWGPAQGGRERRFSAATRHLCRYAPLTHGNRSFGGELVVASETRSASEETVLSLPMLRKTPESLLET